MHINTYAHKQAETYSNKTTHSNIYIRATHAYNLMNAQFRMSPTYTNKESTQHTNITQ